MKKRKIWAALAVFFIIMAIITVVSENVYYDSLPLVAVGNATKGTLSASYWISGHVEQEKKISSLNAGFPFREVTLLAADESILSEGDPIYSVSVDEVKILQKQLELERLSLSEQNRNFRESEGMSGAAEQKNMQELQYELNELKAAEIDKQLAELEELIRSEGIVYADRKGTASYSVYSGMPLQEGQTVAVMTSLVREFRIIWQMSEEQGRLFAVGDSAEIYLDVQELDSEGEIVSAQRPYTLSITDAVYSEQNQSYTFYAEVPSDIPVVMGDGAAVNVNCKYESDQEYSYIVPASAIEFEQDAGGNTGKGYIYAIRSRQRVYGEEYYVIPFYVDILFQLDGYVALNTLMSGYDYVVQYSEPLENNMAVRRY